ncbi:XRE family transcriptional regulator [Marinobacter sp. NP-6]|uniref:helix-turn-helix domain-containing protein n=1 Tax=Marinobacter sp. NP-6 TaxID=2488666 RepID=UPI000FC9E301|nr:helix-turn-helix transcriptional regulator [Marinobacter sp. NP-6]RUT76883.1 XRE family transcriptional regulator [Marinobacter sp. NP-6]
MTKKLNENESRDLAEAIHQKRLALGITLTELEKLTGVNSGQISRFEAGHFKFASRNLQKILNFLQTQPLTRDSSNALGARVEKFAEKSALHRLAVEELLRAIERIDSINPAD